LLTHTPPDHRVRRPFALPVPQRSAGARVGRALLALTVSAAWLAGHGDLAHAQDVTRPAAISDLGTTPDRIYYVDRSNPAANDAGSGTEAVPWRTILKAVKTARAGETVLIKRGTYPENESGAVAVAFSGTAGSPITFAAYPGDERQVIVSGATFRIAGRSHVVVRGLKVTNVTTTTSARGFSIEGPGTNITLSGNETYATYSSGIGVWGVPWGVDPTNYQHLFNITIENNLIRRACDGGYNEFITVANGVNGVIVRNNELTESGNTALGGEGIDFKEGVFGGQISGNYVHDLQKVGIYLDAAGVGIGPGGVEDIDISGNRVRNIATGEAILVSTEGPGNVRNIRLFNNVVQGAFKNGLVLYRHPVGTGTATGVTFINNTAYANTRYGVRIEWPAATGIVARNNLGYLNGYGDLSVAAGTVVTVDHNLSGTNPLFLDALAGDFRLLAGSPAIDAGSPSGAPSVDIAGTTRPQGPAFDIGAFERVP
jgi:hypothetical protein